jgi:hypothetical protein
MLNNIIIKSIQKIHVEYHNLFWRYYECVKNDSKNDNKNIFKVMIQELEKDKEEKKKLNIKVEYPKYIESALDNYKRNFKKDEINLNKDIFMEELSGDHGLNEVIEDMFPENCNTKYDYISEKNKQKIFKLNIEQQLKQIEKDLDISQDIAYKPTDVSEISESWTKVQVKNGYNKSNYQSIKCGCNGKVYESAKKWAGHIRKVEHMKWSKSNVKVVKKVKTV